MRANKSTTTSTLRIRPVDDLAPLPILWAIPNYLPRHSLSAIVAPTGAGLTTLATCICAQLAPPAHGRPDDDLPSVLLLAGRESIFAMRRRLAAAGVNLARILILEDVQDDHSDNYHQDSSFRQPNPSDWRRIAEVLHEYKSIRLVLIDNAEDLFSTTHRPSRNKVLRQLACFQSLAESREVAVTLLTAIPSLQRDPFRSTFLSALHHYCRTLHLLAPDPESPKHRLLFTIKNTLIAPNPTLRLDLAQPAFPQDTTVPELTYAEYLHLLKAPAKTGPAPDSRNYAIEVLRELLSPGRRLPVGQREDPAPGTIHFLIRQAGLSFATVLRAKEQLGIAATRDRKRWYWHNPATPEITTTPPKSKPSAPPHETCAPSSKSANSEPATTPPQPPFPPTIYLPALQVTSASPDSPDLTAEPTPNHPTPEPATAP